MEKDKQEDPFGKVLGISRGDGKSKVVWYHLSDDQRKIALSYSLAIIKKRICDGDLGHLSPKLLKICAATYRLVETPKYHLGSKDAKGDNINYQRDLFKQLHKVADFSQILDAEAEAYCVEQYKHFTDCNHTPSVSLSGPWVHITKGGEALCLSCALEREKKEVLTADSWQAYMKFIHGNKLISETGYVEACGEDDEALDRVLFSVTKIVVQDKHISHLECEDAKGGTWYGLKADHCVHLTRRDIPATMTR